MKELAEDLEMAISDATDACDDAAEQFISKTVEQLQQSKYQIEALLKERLEQWNKKKESELQIARTFEDSYYRYRLVKLVQDKNKAVLAAMQSVRHDWTEFINQSSQ